MLFAGTRGPEQAAPRKFKIPRIEGATSDDWTDWHGTPPWCRAIAGDHRHVVDMRTSTHPRGVADHFKNIFEGHVATST